METGIDLAAALTDLANLAPTEKAIARLRAKWPEDFLPTPPSNYQIEVKYLDEESGKVVASDLPANIQWVVWLAGVVKALWIGNPQPKVTQALEEILLTGKLVPLDLSPIARQFVTLPAPIPGVFRVDWRRQKFVYIPKTILQAALHFLLEHSDKAKVCGNPDCPAPYFIAKRGNKKYCSDDCETVGRKASKSKWWDEHGDEWREARKPKNSKRKKRK